MITIYTHTPDELVKGLKEYFLIVDHFVILSCVEEIDGHIDDWADLYSGYYDEQKHKICFKLPFLAITTNQNLIIELVSTFDTVIMNEINNILEDGIKFIQCGFLPLNIQSIIYYIDNVILTSSSSTTCCVQSVVFTIFQTLGYLTNSNEPTSRLINTLNESEEDEYIKYANILTLNISNHLLDTSSEEYKALIFEILKLVDYLVHVAADMALNESNEVNESNNEDSNESSNQ